MTVQPVVDASFQTQYKNRVDQAMVDAFEKVQWAFNQSVMLRTRFDLKVLPAIKLTDTFTSTGKELK